jgi:hypothetical protein
MEALLSFVFYSFLLYQLKETQDIAFGRSDLAFSTTPGLWLDVCNLVPAVIFHPFMKSVQAFYHQKPNDSFYRLSRKQMESPEWRHMGNC